MPLEAILLAIGAAIWKMIKELPEIFSGRRKGLREEAEFADKFLKRVQEGDLPKFAIEAGYQALAGNREVSAKAVEHVLSISEEPRLLRSYVAGQGHLELIERPGEVRFEFKRKYKRPSGRLLRQCVYFAIYLASFVCAFLPIYWAIQQMQMKPLVNIIVGGPIFLSLAYFCLNESHKIKCAEELMDAQGAGQVEAQEPTVIAPAPCD